MAEVSSPGGTGGEVTEPLNLAQVGRQICQECIVARCQRYGQFSKKMRLLLLSSGEGGGDGLPHSLAAIVTAVRYLQSAHPNVYGSCSARLRVTMSSDAAVRQAFSRIVDELLLVVSPVIGNGVTVSGGGVGSGDGSASGGCSKSSSSNSSSSNSSSRAAGSGESSRGGNSGSCLSGSGSSTSGSSRSGSGSRCSESDAIMTWGRLVSTIAVCCALSADCVLQGHPELVLVVLDCFEEACEERAVHSWLSAIGGWEGVASIIRDASVEETSRSPGSRSRAWTSFTLSAATRLGAVKALLIQVRRRHPLMVGFAVVSCIASLLAVALTSVGPTAAHR